MVMFVKVSDAMSRSPITVTLKDSVQDCAKKMFSLDVGSLVVQENGILRGIITEKDLIDKVVAKALDPKRRTAADIMTVRLHTISPDKNLQDAVRFMNENGVHRLPVVDQNNKIIGMLTHADIVKIQPALIDLITERFRIGKHTL
jgi:CBS domain-containing protein